LLKTQIRSKSFTNRNRYTFTKNKIYHY